MTFASMMARKTASASIRAGARSARKLVGLNLYQTGRQRVCAASASSAVRITTVAGTGLEKEGAPGKEDFRVFYTSDGKRTSPWRGAPLYKDKAAGLVHFYCEIPKETDAKMECATDEKLNPIKQDTKKGKLRYYPYNINWNYGMLPQTWEDPKVANAECGGVCGDNDPVDVVEIGSTPLEMGGMYAVKVIGCYAMIDDGELDWKVIAIAEEDPMADKVNAVEDVEKLMPGELEKIRVWFRDYKTPDGKPQNAYGYDDKCMPKDFTMGVIEETHEHYSKLVSGARENDEELSLE